MSNISSKIVFNIKVQFFIEVSVEIIGGKFIMISFDVVKYFWKRYDNVLWDIKNLECFEDFVFFNFEECFCMGVNNRLELYVCMICDGFIFFCMGFIGKEVMYWKVVYINVFNKMEQVIIE